jgi:D-alanine-D-alanine ligase
MKISLMVIFGGASNEHEVSLRSAAAVLKHIDRSKYDVLQMGITRAGEWYLYNGPASKIESGAWESDINNLTHVAILPNGEKSVFLCLCGSMKQIRPDVVFPVVHGQNCEDGRLQGTLDIMKLPYVGCGCFSSAICMDKAAAKTALESEGIPMARWECVRRSEIKEKTCERLEKKFAYPKFVKPSNSGSSVGASLANNRQELLSALSLAAKTDEKILVEEYIDGREVELAVLDGARTVVSCSGEIEAGSTFYDYDTKYKTDTARFFMPARVSEGTETKLRNYALKIFRALDCQGLARVDFFVTRDDERIIFNEINTLPGFTSSSMYPKLMERSGVCFTMFVDALISAALKDKNEIAHLGVTKKRKK